MKSGRESFKENVTILTGASSGIGRAMALQLAEQGAWLMLAARDEAALQEVASQCEAKGARARISVTDVSDEAQCRALIERTLFEFNRIDTLINNAGITMWARFDAMQDTSVFTRIITTNYLGSLWCTYYALPHLKQSRGRIVGISSLSGKTGVPLRSGYAASKHAVTGFFDSLRIELHDSGVSVTVIYPDFVNTKTRERAFGPDGKPLGAGNSPVQEGRVMTADDCARFALRGIAGRKREVIMTARGRLGQWLKLIAPGLVDRIAMRAIKSGR